MKVLRGYQNKKGKITELVGELEERPLAWCLWHSIPWLTPHKDIESPKPWSWQASSTIAYFRSWFGNPPLETEEPPSDGIYNAEVAVPYLTIDQVMMGLITKKRRFFFCDTEEMSVLGELYEMCEAEGKDLETETNRGAWCIYPLSTLYWLVKQIEEEFFIHLGLSAGLASLSGRDAINAIEVRFWKVPGRIDRIDSADGSCILIPENMTSMRLIGKQGWTPFELKSIITESDLPPFLFAYPVHHETAEILIETPLAEMDEIFVPRTHSKNQATIGQLVSYVSRRLSKKIKNSSELVDVLAEYVKQKESDLTTAIGAPMMVLSEESGESAKSWVSAPRAGQLIPKPSDLEEVRTVLSDLVEDGNDNVADLLLNLLSRACVVMHLRNTTSFDAQYKTGMFTYEGLIQSLLEADPQSDAGYTTPFLMIGPLGRKKRAFTERKKDSGGAVSSPLIGAKNGW